MDQQPPQSTPPGDVPAPPTSAPLAPPPVASPPVAWQAAAEPVGPAPGVEFAGFGARLIAYIVDGIVLGVVITVLSLLLVPLLAGTTDRQELGGTGAAVLTIWLAVVLLVSLLYFPFFWQRSGQTPGMKLLNIRVVRDRDGGPLGWGAAILRYIGYALNSIIFGLPIGFLWALFDARRRGWHDMLGGSVVIRA